MVGQGTLKPKILYSSLEEKFQENLEEFNPEMSTDKLSKFDKFFETLCHDSNPLPNKNSQRFTTATYFVPALTLKISSAF